mmetsp:Transcript_4101/g.6305  ORF Transcript_4101/g.6305 Transcript_4101/m.6305 type:complete len:103 (-) Transcript_4101:116-424(-)
MGPKTDREGPRPVPQDAGPHGVGRVVKAQHLACKEKRTKLSADSAGPRPHDGIRSVAPELTKDESRAVNDATKCMQKRAQPPPKHVDWKPSHPIFQPRQGPW